MDEWLEDVKTIKASSYNDDKLGKGNENLLDYLNAVKNGQIDELDGNFYGKKNPCPGIVIFVKKEKNKVGKVVCFCKLIYEKEKIIIKDVYFFEKSGIDENDEVWKGVQLTSGLVNCVFSFQKNEDQFNNLKVAIKKVLEKRQNCLITPNCKNISVQNMSKQIIFYGPPGTGKTREAKIRAAEIIGINISKVDEEIEKTEGRIKLVQFHPSYSYFDFVEGIEVGEKGFELKDKVFKEFANKAAEALNNKQLQNKNYVLIIDEINRANMASVFGELLYALEYRGKIINTSGGDLVVPDNVYIIGTMNTADVSIAGIDYAVRRRFDFVKMNSHMPDGTFKNSDDEYKIEGNTLSVGDKTYDFSTAWEYDENDNLSNYQVEDKWFISNLYNRVRIDMQNSVARGVNIEDIMPGISYFLVNENDEVDKKHLNYKIDYELVPLLSEYAKNGLFSKRYKISDSKSLYEMLKNMEYSQRLKIWIKKKEVKVMIID